MKQAYCNCLFAFVFSVVVVALSAAPVHSQTSSQFNIMPLPAKAQLGTGSLRIDGTFSVVLAGYKEARLEAARERFLRSLTHQTGLVFAHPPADPTKAALTVTTDHASKPIQEPGEDESYALEVTPGGAHIRAATPLGAMHGLQTFLQLVSITAEGFAVPAVSIQDQPRFVWRGLMIDSARHFIPLPIIKRNLDGLEAVKMNVLHWHLSDNEGFRVESKKFPKLQELGSDGQFYSQDEIRDLIAYARDRGIRVVPEFDMPGHSTAWFVGYPELASGQGPYELERKWGVFDPAMDPSNEKTYKFLETFVGEMAKLFPDPYFHIGGDEVNGKEWDSNPKIQEFIKSHNIKNNVELQAYFSQRLQEIVTKHGKTPIGWDEIFVPGASKNILIHSWRGPDALAAAAKQGYRGILSNGYYIDLGWSAARHYAVDPMGGAAANLAAEEKARILGGEDTMWSEYVNWENVDSRVWPRTAAIAERLWSPQETTDVASMYTRMEAESSRLEFLGLTHRTYQRLMVQRMAGAAPVAQFEALFALTKALEPVKDYNRENSPGEEPTSLKPLTRVVDATHPESMVSRRFSLAVDDYVGGSCKDTAKSEEIRARLNEWVGLNAPVQVLAQDSSLVKDAVPAAAALSQSSALSLNALDRIRQGLPLTDDLKKQQVDALNAFETQAHKSQLTLPARAAFQKLVESAGTGGACTDAK